MSPYLLFGQAFYLQMMRLRSLIFYFWESYGGLVQFLALIISVTFLLLIIYLLARLRFVNFQIERFMDILGVGDLSRRRSVWAWRQIQKRLRLGGAENLRLAVAEADKILDELVKLSGYRGETMEDRLNQLTPAQLSNIEELKQVHHISRRLLREPDYQIGQEAAEIAVSIYKKAFQEFGLID